ncbi:MAG: histidine kinase [Cyclobacteriaceae bacterium]
MKKERLYWILQITGWSLYGLGSVLLYSFVQGEIPPGLIEGEIFQVSFYIISTHLLRVLIKRGKWISLPLGTLILRIALSIVILSLANYVFLLGVSFSLDTLNRQDFMAINAIISIIAPLTIYFLWSLTYMTLHYFQWYKKSLEYQAAFNEIELNYLKSQLNPHFIFNALNSIRALVGEDPDKCKEAITQLSHILRNSLILDKKRLISFSDEMRTVNDYLALETIRFEERLKTKFKFHPDSSQYNVPPMMIQTLVENAIKHGISNLTAGGVIDINTEVVDRSLIIQIKNSGKYKNGAKIKKSGTGNGLVNTKKRLELIYGNAASFKICNIENNTVLTEIKIPETF